MKFRAWIHSATLQLTLWYLLILAVLSVLFSVIVYNIAARELHRPLSPGTQTQMMNPQDTTSSINFEALRLQREEQGKRSLVINLVVFNIAVIATGGLASYLLARRTLEPIEEALEAQTRFSSDAAHELRTPLAVMQSEIEIGLRDKKASVSKQRMLLQSNLDEVDRMRQLTDRLLLLSNTKQIETTATALDDVATEAINRIIPAALHKKIAVETTVGKQRATANAEILTDVLVILLDNAIKYSPAKSQVQISAYEQGRHVVFAVKDSGIGIDAKDLPHIFDRFYRADVSRSKVNVEGHGLGLSIAKRSIEAMGGTIAATSEPSGTGTTFTIRLQA